ncbi:MAG: T9SS type A sorting domain-containing protein [Flavobacterium sp.]|nr:MAG: T9SS type A sorting domain-containing protein [Flavobacterium sp.]
MKKLYSIVFYLTLLSSPLFAQTIRYVKEIATGTGDGSSWINASNSLQGMIDASASGDQVWVAKGTYKPTLALRDVTTDGMVTTARDQTFILRKGVKIYGGFLGGETGLSQRNFVANITVLSGDLNSNDNDSDPATKQDNAYHVVSSLNDSDGAVLDGFTIQQGYANGTKSISLIASPSSTTSIAQNVGGGIATRGTNTATTFINLVISNNYALGSGGGVFARVSSGQTVSVEFPYENIHFLNNKSGDLGGGLYVYGGLYVPIVKMNSIRFTGNSASSSAGALYIGGATATSYPVVIATNNVFYNNVSEDTGGAIYLASYTNATITNSTFYMNKSVDTRGAVSFNAGSSTTFNLHNNIFHANQGSYSTTPISADLRLSAGAKQNFKNNLFQNFNVAAGADDDFTGNIVNASPSSLFASTISTDADFLKLAPTSIALDAGLNSLSVEAVDLANNPRIRNTAIDLGAYELQVGNYPLPVTLESYTAIKKGSTALLSWKTASEQNNQKFVIERGSSATNFAFFKDIAGAGESNISLSYSVTDFAPLAGTNYYRLTQVDNDGKSKVLGIEAVTFDLDIQKTTTYPNPAKDYVWVKPSSSNGIVSLNLISLTGKIISTNNYAQAAAQQSVKLDLTNIPAGAYVLWVNKGKSNAEKQTLLVVK